ncbi:ABC transporter ATP-binding protein [Pseudodesulfovibrio methanolicus]|uniref:ABC transporter ATP-binding protein n=1 Tax=Pseudodesulfovibrio methanolicus TaxID=3126690 RepID=A0ABZ2IYT3_9BACT
MLLEIKNLTSFYGDAQILFDVNLEVEEGTVVGLFGRNGAGKSTTFRSIMGFNNPQCEGEIKFKGRDITCLPPYKIAKLGIGWVPEDRKIFPNLTIKENLLLGQRSKPDGRGGKEVTLDAVYKYFPKLKEMERKWGCEMSGGEQQMLTIGRTLMSNPDLILLDEPTEGLAPLIADQVMEMVLEVKREYGMALIVVEQFSPKFLSFMDHCYVLEIGEIIYDGNAKTLEDDVELQQKLLGVG